MNRDEVRIEFGKQLQLALEASGLVSSDPQQVFDHLVADFGALSPVVMLAPGGTDPQPVSMGYLYDVHVYVLYADESSQWTPDKSQTRLDQIYNAIATWLRDPVNKNRLLWKSIKQTAPSIVIPEAVGGAGYWHEIIPVRAEV